MNKTRQIELIIAENKEPLLNQHQQFPRISFFALQIKCNSIRKGKRVEVWEFEEESQAGQ